MPEPLSGIVDTSAPYRGVDRRGVIAADETPQLMPLIVGALVIVVGFGLTSLGAANPGVFSALDAAALTSILTAAGVTVGVAAGALLVLRWRLVGDAAALWCGAGILVLSVASVAIAQLLPLIVVDGLEPEVIRTIRPAGLIVATSAFAIALRVPPVDMRLRPLHVIGGALAAALGLTAVMLSVPGLDNLVGVSAGGDFPTYTEPAFVCLAWTALSTVYFFRGARTGRPLLRWFGLLLYGLTFAELSGAVGASAQQSAWDTGSSLLVVAALAFGAIGAARELDLSFRVKDLRLFATSQMRDHDAEQLRRVREAQAERAHEARNALAAIDGATKTLERHRDRLDAETREVLSSAIADEIERMQRLVSASSSSTSLFRISFHVDEVVRAQVALARSQGLRVLTDLRKDIVAVGRPADLAEVVQNLLVNAGRHADGSTAVVRTTVHDGRALVRIEDRGPGIPVHARGEIFERAVTAASTGGSGLGLHVSAKLMREQQGDLWVEDREGGGAAFIAALPLADRSAGALDGAKPPLERGQAPEPEHSAVGVRHDDGAAAV